MATNTSVLTTHRIGLLAVDIARTNPGVRDDTDEVLWRERIENWNKEFDGVLLRRILALQKEELMMQNHFTIHIFNKDPETLQKERTINTFWF